MARRPTPAVTGSRAPAMAGKHPASAKRPVRSPRFCRRPLLRVLGLAVVARILTLALLHVVPFLYGDYVEGHEGTGALAVAAGFDRRLWGPFVRWDGEYFVAAAAAFRDGTAGIDGHFYSLDHHHAFFPGFGYLLAALVRVLPLSIPAAGAALNNLLAVWNAGVVYKLAEAMGEMYWKAPEAPEAPEAAPGGAPEAPPEAAPEAAPGGAPEAPPEAAPEAAPRAVAEREASGASAGGGPAGGRVRARKAGARGAAGGAAGAAGGGWEGVKRSPEGCAAAASDASGARGVAGDASLPACAATLYAFSAGSVFQSVLYSESVFAALQLSAAWLCVGARERVLAGAGGEAGGEGGGEAGGEAGGGGRRVRAGGSGGRWGGGFTPPRGVLPRVALALALLAASTTIRSNGIFGAAYLALPLAAAFCKRPSAALFALAVAFGLATLPVLVAFPFLWGGFGEKLFCASAAAGAGHPPAWCESGGVFPLYRFVQSTYWRVGFLRYWKWSKIDKFLMGLPAYVVVAAATGIQIGMLRKALKEQPAAEPAALPATAEPASAASPASPAAPLASPALPASTAAPPASAASTAAPPPSRVPRFFSTSEPLISLLLLFAPTLVISTITAFIANAEIVNRMSLSAPGLFFWHAALFRERPRVARACAAAMGASFVLGPLCHSIWMLWT